MSWAEHAIVANGAAVEAKARKLITLSAALLTYLSNNKGGLIEPRIESEGRLRRALRG